MIAQQFKRSIGEEYNLRKQGHGGEIKSSRQNDDLIAGRVREQMAEETGLGPATIERYGRAARAPQRPPERRSAHGHRAAATGAGAASGRLVARGEPSGGSGAS